MAAETYANVISLSEMREMLETEILHAVDLVRKKREEIQKAESQLQAAKDDKERVYWEEELKRLKNWRLPHDKAPMMFWGPPGSGKTEGISGTVRSMLEKFGVRVGLIVSQLSTYDMISIRGLPTVDRENETTKWFPQDSFPSERNCKDYDVVVWFMDELSAAPKAVQPPLYSLLQFGSIENGITLPSNVMIVAAGNDKDDRAIAFDMSSATSNRLVHFDVRPSLEAWKDWALPNGIHPMVIAFHNANQGEFLYKLDSDATGMIKGFPTLRSWKRVSDDLYMYEKNERLRELRVIGNIGSHAGIAFNTFFRVHDQLPDPEKILDGEIDTVPGEDHLKYATLSNLVAHLVAKYDPKRVDNFFAYVTKATADRKEIGYMAVQDALRAADRNLKKLFQLSKEWSAWADIMIKLNQW